MAVSGLRIGLLGGSFDPVHLAHIALAQAAYTQLRLDRVELIPAAQPWQKPPLAASPKHRLAMLALASKERPWLRINPIEIHREGPTYTIDTLRSLPDNNLYYWILGSDQLGNFCTWNSWQEIAQRVCLVVALRPHTTSQTPAALQHYLQRLKKDIVRLDFVPQDISGTTIRQCLARQQTVNHLLDSDVAAYIRAHRLYESDQIAQHKV